MRKRGREACRSLQGRERRSSCGAGKSGCASGMSLGEGEGDAGKKGGREGGKRRRSEEARGGEREARKGEEGGGGRRRRRSSCRSASQHSTAFVRRVSSRVCPSMATSLGRGCLHVDSFKARQENLTIFRYVYRRFVIATSPAQLSLKVTSDVKASVSLTVCSRLTPVATPAIPTTVCMLAWSACTSAATTPGTCSSTPSRGNTRSVGAAADVRSPPASDSLSRVCCSSARPLVRNSPLLLLPGLRLRRRPGKDSRARDCQLLLQRHVDLLGPQLR